MKPFTKWAGGKGLLLDQIRPHVPLSFGRYFEPFIGGGAMLWELRPDRAIIGDANPHLVNCYVAIRDYVEDLISDLGCLKYDRDVYMSVRSQFNTDMGAPITVRAAWFLYMNKAGFNGLCRYNGSGEFNVPFGRYTNPTICDSGNLRSCSRALRNVTIKLGDYEDTCATAGVGDFVYLDPPYVPASDTAKFTAYTPGSRWTALSDERCARFFWTLAERGCHVLMSNSDTPRSRKLYKGARILEVQRSGGMNCDPSNRGKVPEILVLPP